ncbi:hypothetical protein EES41_41085 (plasmid) [Streptomyces sp. ADI95-16]|uniref:hypothetical protein n=1 Tax=Streptomyces sp. ADI95-16 TaxID=1522758 RepID=UPI000F3A8B00|nr:hypothetical protein [Streptomyces sp. ADI95-16]AYV33175.1 hypothetical protein EES41_41085 [Streptomyces sp. ADI95-16]
MSHRSIRPAQCASCAAIARYLERCTQDRPDNPPTNGEIGAAVGLHPKVAQRHLAHLVACGVLDTNRRTLLLPPRPLPALAGPEAWASTVPGLHATTVRALMVPARMGWTGQLANDEWAEAAGLRPRTLEWHRRVLAGRTPKQPIPLISFRRTYVEVVGNDNKPYHLRQADRFTLLSGIEAAPLEGDALASVPELARAVLHRVRWFDYAMSSKAGVEFSAREIARYLAAGWPAHTLAAILNATADRRPQHPREFLKRVLDNEPRLKGAYVIPAQVQFEGMARKGECLLCHNPAWELPGRTPLCGGDRCREGATPAESLDIRAGAFVPLPRGHALTA